MSSLKHQDAENAFHKLLLDWNDESLITSFHALSRYKRYFRFNGILAQNAPFWYKNVEMIAKYRIPKYLIKRAKLSRNSLETKTPEFHLFYK